MMQKVSDARLAMGTHLEDFGGGFLGTGWKNTVPLVRLGVGVMEA